MNQNNRNVLIVITQAENAGAQKAVLKLYDYLRDTSGYIAVAFMYILDHGYYESVKARGYNVCSLLKSKSIKNILQLFNLRKIVKQREITHVITYTHWSNIIVPLILLGTGAVVFANKRGSLLHYPKLRFIEGCILRSYLIKKVICVSKSLCSEATEKQGISSRKVFYIPNGISIDYAEEYERTIGQTIKFLFVGRLHEQKGINFLLKGFKLFLDSQETKSNFKLIILGDGALRNEVLGFIKAHNLSEYIEVKGQTLNTAEYYSGCDILLLPSLWEGFPNVLLEAGAYSMPVIATAIDGNTELIKDKETGVNIERASEISLMNGMKYAVSNAEKMLAYGTNLRELVTNSFSDEKIADMYKTNLFDMDYK